MDEVEHDGELDMVLASQLVQDLQLGGVAVDQGSSNAESAISQLSRNTRRGSFTRGKTSTVFELAP